MYAWSVLTALSIRYKKMVTKRTKRPCAMVFHGRSVNCACHGVAAVSLCATTFFTWQCRPHQTNKLLEEASTIHQQNKTKRRRQKPAGSEEGKLLSLPVPPAQKFSPPSLASLLPLPPALVRRWMRRKMIASIFASSFLSCHHQTGVTHSHGRCQAFQQPTPRQTQGHKNEKTKKVGSGSVSVSNAALPASATLTKRGPQLLHDVGWGCCHRNVPQEPASCSRGSSW